MHQIFYKNSKLNGFYQVVLLILILIEYMTCSKVMGYIITSCNIQVEKTRISILYFFVDITILYKFSISIVENQSVWRIQTKVIKNNMVYG